MDKKSQGKENRFAWLPAAMPGVAKLMAEKRRLLGNEHVAECWKRGVLKLEPGWFFAREGALAVGTAWPDIADLALGGVATSTQALVVLREKDGAPHGT